MRRASGWVIAGGIGLVLGGGAGAFAALQTTGVIHACVANQGGALRVASTCRSTEHAVSWNKQGRPGPVTGALPRGVTLRGTWTLRDQAAAVGNDISQPISWGFSLATAPATHFVPTGTPAPSGCAGGSAAAPAADPGNVCIYEAGGTNASVKVFDTVAASFDTSERYGTGILVEALAAGEYGAFGTWAVTGS